ncbi:oxidoreductase [Dacryopinax primogenitus]|uniref:Oxidoreductase n=1 Tax=Dacryopinax primogenitus (strain DJM 731) TaxID=1858805 RepID=M5G8M9_DACPD|nr:oxidoreductase [Dacryopinax primogenitus]EJU05104.1 oxidoreductase [Dacryopinax primogenitus]
MPVPAEDLPVTHHHTIYPGIEPSKFSNTLTNKIVFITGAFRGIGAATAIAFARSGASLFLVARNKETLDKVKDSILQVVPNANIETWVVDVVDHLQVQEAVRGCLTAFGQIDVVISNAAEIDAAIVQQEPSVWWHTWEVNIKGSFNVAHFTLPELEKTKGYLMLLSSIGAQRRDIRTSGYASGKHAINRIAEFAAIESPSVTVFSVHPGAVMTELAKSGGDFLAPLLIDDVQLPAWTMVRLVQGKEDYLSGRYISVNWDLDEVHDDWKNAILEDDALKNRLALPSGA